MMVLFIGIKWGWNDSSTTFKMKSIVAKAACSQVVYDYGFNNSFVTYQLPAWENKIISAIERNTLLNANLNLLLSDHS